MGHFGDCTREIGQFDQSALDISCAEPQMRDEEHHDREHPIWFNSE
ncbi:hypothetical protein PT7_0881 [Pusillimonas sp. T7-7]|nr:hypothetical protein PT7_0881 [Pusillimonas sp. T7-7]